MVYAKQTWQNFPSLTTPISAPRLNHIEDGILDASTKAEAAIPDTPEAREEIANSPEIEAKINTRATPAQAEALAETEVGPLASTTLLNNIAGTDATMGKVWTRIVR